MRAASDKARLAGLCAEMRRAADPAKARLLAGFFKTGKGQYGEGDVFLGIMVPLTRKIALRFADLPFADIDRLLHSKFHEERLAAFLILVERYRRGDAKTKRDVYAFYLEHADYANNWDLVDLSAPKIAGAWLLEHPSLRTLAMYARSKNLWRRRIAIVATFAFIGAGDFGPSFAVADMLLHDGHDLIHKATGWMLREVGKRDKAALVRWLRPRYRRMPRTMLRYAIERFPEAERKRYLVGKV
ncbi:MAG TPA: DNA alkylation repair protein [Candidatus Binatia bacterium]|jgi:3-methyladenine DNA glycosylase AlkD|nr:DNA alkylation repair protein [Candidatus Binatia bacterium]